VPERIEIGRESGILHQMQDRIDRSANMVFIPLDGMANVQFVVPDNLVVDFFLEIKKGEKIERSQQRDDRQKTGHQFHEPRIRVKRDAPPTQHVSFPPFP
jgi:hypothetical protein